MRTRDHERSPPSATSCRCPCARCTPQGRMHDCNHSDCLRAFYSISCNGSACLRAFYSVTCNGSPCTSDQPVLDRNQKETIMVPAIAGRKLVMPTNLTLKNIPDEVYDRLRWSAETHRRSINNEAIVCLEAILAPARVPVSERISRARGLRAGLPKKFKAKEVDRLKREGRP